MRKEVIIKTGFCVSYDWELLKKSIPRIYEASDVICLAVDKNRQSWSGNAYAFDNEAFYSFVRSIDTEKKIDIYEDDFSLRNLDARQNCNRHRTLIAERMGKGGWHVQVDSDEYFINFPGFVDELKRINPNPTGSEKPLNVCASWIPLIKKTATGYLYVDYKDGLPEAPPFATTRPLYERARHNGYFNVLTRTVVIHETWARSDEDLLFKISNWGHASEELREREIRKSYYNLWKILDENNYGYVTNFHPAVPHVWPALGFCKGHSIEEFMQNFRPPELPLTDLQLRLRNIRNVARVKSLYNKILKRA